FSKKIKFAACFTRAIAVLREETLLFPALCPSVSSGRHGALCSAFIDPLLASSLRAVINQSTDTG
ncbi:hypothetical protein AMECASPLE_034716, partial [Ameca splendens]